MAHVVLGLLLIAPQSFYDLIKGFEAGVALFYSSSSGSIRRALDRLLDQGLIEAAETEPGQRGRKVYRATEAGRREFRAWMTAEPSGSDVESATLSRLYFLGLLEPAERAPVLDRIRVRYETELARLVDLDRRLTTADVPDELKDVAAHQRATLDHGIASARFALDWFREYAERHARTDR